MRVIQLTGYVVTDAEKKINKSGKEFMTFRMGNNEFNDPKDEQGRSKTYWFRITTYNQRHFGLKQYLTKGKRLIVFGDYSDNVYQNREGNCEIGREILANAIYFNDDSGANKTTNETATANPSPVTQTTMVSKPTTADLKVPAVEPASNADDDDDLPF